MLPVRYFLVHLPVMGFAVDWLAIYVANANPAKVSVAIALYA